MKMTVSKKVPAKLTDLTLEITAGGMKDIVAVHIERAARIIRCKKDAMAQVDPSKIESYPVEVFNAVKDLKNFFTVILDDGLYKAPVFDEEELYLAFLLCGHLERSQFDWLRKLAADQNMN